MPWSSSWLEPDGITSDPNCVLVDLRLSGKMDLLGACEPDDSVLLTESDSLMGDSRRVPRIGTLFDEGKMAGLVARFCAVKATPVAIDWMLLNGLLLLLLWPFIRLSFSGVGIRSRTRWPIWPFNIPLESGLVEGSVKGEKENVSQSKQWKMLKVTPTIKLNESIW